MDCDAPGGGTVTIIFIACQLPDGLTRIRAVETTLEPDDALATALRGCAPAWPLWSAPVPESADGEPSTLRSAPAAE